jgi:shikimate dehydrogenase
MRKYGLIGFPLGHSFSKQYFTNKFILEAIQDCEYENYELSDLIMLTTLLKENNNICGLNVTIPYKTEVIKFLDSVDSEALEAGAVNVIKIFSTQDRRFLKGFNTDIYGFRETLVPYLNSSVKSALVFGTGGSSKAVAYVLRKLGLSVTFVSRNAGADSVKYSDINDKIISENRLIVNTTPLGMHPDIHSFPDFNYQWLSNNHILYDLVYNPERTQFLEKGKEQGCTVITGKEMLILQAEKSWSIWNDNSL